MRRDALTEALRTILAVGLALALSIEILFHLTQDIAITLLIVGLALFSSTLMLETFWRFEPSSRLRSVSDLTSDYWRILKQAALYWLADVIVAHFSELAHAIALRWRNREHLPSPSDTLDGRRMEDDLMHSG